MERRPLALGMVLWRFVLVVVPLVVVLGVVNALPQFLGGEPLGVVRYEGVTQLEQRLRLAAWRPVELPAPWSWPPARVRLAAGRPTWLQFVFEAAGDRTGDLVLCQAVEIGGAAAVQPPWLLRLQHVSASDLETPEALLAPGELLQETEVTIDGRAARLRRLLLRDGAIVHEVWWQQAASRVMLRLGGPADRLTRVAAAIVRTR